LRASAQYAPSSHFKDFITSRPALTTKRWAQHPPLCTRHGHRLGHFIKMRVDSTRSKGAYICCHTFKIDLATQTIPTPSYEALPPSEKLTPTSYEALPPSEKLTPIAPPSLRAPPSYRTSCSCLGIGERALSKSGEQEPSRRFHEGVLSLASAKRTF